MATASAAAVKTKNTEWIDGVEYCFEHEESGYFADEDDTVAVRDDKPKKAKKFYRQEYRFTAQMYPSLEIGQITTDLFDNDTNAVIMVFEARQTHDIDYHISDTITFHDIHESSHSKTIHYYPVVGNCVTPLMRDHFVKYIKTVYQGEIGTKTKFHRRIQPYACSTCKERILIRRFRFLEGTTQYDTDQENYPFCSTCRQAFKRKVLREKYCDEICKLRKCIESLDEQSEFIDSSDDSESPDFRI